MDKLAFQKHLGLRLRQRRRLLGMTLLALAEACDISYQQIHKYEMGAMAVSAAMLWKLALALEIPVTYFYDGLPPYTGLRPQAKFGRGLARAFEDHLAERRDARKTSKPAPP
jgi:transcriptional regulator with XRE-family HTH domain